jgi:hypothetical protein
MKRLGLVLGVVAVLAFVAAGSVFAADGGGKAPGGKGGKGNYTMGEITKIDGKTLTIKSSREGTPDVTATVDEATEIAIVRIQVGDKRAYGEITKIEGKAITVKGRSAEETITVDDSAVIMVMAKAEFKDLKVGQQVMASITNGKLARITVRAAK